MKTLLDAARKAYPGEWVQTCKGIRMRNPKGTHPAFGQTFKLETSLADQMALQIALEREGIVFRFKDGEFWGVREGHGCNILFTGKSKPELLLAIVRQGGGA